MKTVKNLANIKDLSGFSVKDEKSSNDSNKHHQSRKKPNNSNTKKLPAQGCQNDSQTVMSDQGLELTTIAQVKRFQAIATVNITHARPDLQKIVGISQLDKLPPRLKSYLKVIGAVQGDMTLTPKGEKLRDEGKISLPEKGVYNLWYAEHALIGTRLIAIQRINATAATINEKVFAKKTEAKIQLFNVDSPINVRCFNADKEEWLMEHIDDAQIEIISVHHRSPEATLNWRVSGGNELEVNTILNTQIVKGDRFDSPKKSIERAISLTFDLPPEYKQRVWRSFAQQVQGHWEDERSSIMMPLTEQIDNFSCLNSCTLREKPIAKLNVNKLGSFEICGFNGVNIEPIDSKEGERWLASWVNYYFSQKPFTPLQAEKDQLAWRSKPQIAHHDIAPLGQHDILTILERDGRKQAYWNATSTMDLVPSQPKSIGLPLTLNEGDMLTPAKLMVLLSGELAVEKMVISDRYYQTEHQRCLLHAINAQLVGKNSTFITSERQQCQGLPPQWQMSDFGKNRPENHDRYWLLYTSVGVKAWKLSTSMDFLRANGAHWSVIGHPTFTPLTLDDLPSYLTCYTEAKV